MNLRQAAQRALKAMEDGEDRADMIEFSDALIALRAALAEPDSDYERGFVDGMNLQTKGSVDKAVNRIAEPEQEPVAWVVYDTDNNDIAWSETGKRLKAETPLYTAPTPRKPLTDDEIGKIAGDCLDAWSCARAIERAHGIGEQQ